MYSKTSVQDHLVIKTIRLLRQLVHKPVLHSEIFQADSETTPVLRPPAQLTWSNFGLRIRRFWVPGPACTVTVDVAKEKERRGEMTS